MTENPILTEWDRTCMAYHEAGHAVCSFFLPEREKLLLITIDPSSESFGMIKTAPRLHHNETFVSFSSMISTLLAGRLAEEIFLGTLTTSCIYDLASVQEIAANMVLKFGMGKILGVKALKNTENIALSESCKEKICADIQAIIRDAENNTKSLLLAHGQLVNAVAQRLLEQGTLTEDEIVSIFVPSKGF